MKINKVEELPEGNQKDESFEINSDFDDSQFSIPKIASPVNKNYLIVASAIFLVMIGFVLYFFVIKDKTTRETLSTNNNTGEDELKRKELALKEKDIKIKEEELLRKREESIEKKEKVLNQEKKAYVNIEGKFDGSVKDGTYWVVYINNFNGRNFNGYNVIYWQKSPEGMRTNFSGEFNSSDNSITIYEDKNAKGSGTFYGKVSSDEKTISGTWYRYSDGGSFTWNLTKVN